MCRDSCLHCVLVRHACPPPRPGTVQCSKRLPAGRLLLCCGCVDGRRRDWVAIHSFLLDCGYVLPVQISSSGTKSPISQSPCLMSAYLPGLQCERGERLAQQQKHMRRWNNMRYASNAAINTSAVQRVAVLWLGFCNRPIHYSSGLM